MKYFLLIAIAFLGPLTHHCSGAEFPTILHDGLGEPLEIIVSRDTKVIHCKKPPQKQNGLLSLFKKPPKPPADLYKTVRLVDVDRKTVLQHFTYSLSPRNVELSPNGNRFVLRHNLCDSKTGKVIRTFIHPGVLFYDCHYEFMKNGDYLYCATEIYSSDGSSKNLKIEIYKAEDGTTVFSKSFPFIYGMALSPDGKYFVCSSSGEPEVDYVVDPSIWDIKSGKKIIQLDSNNTRGSPAGVLDWSSDNSHVMTGLGRNTIAVWNIQTRNLVQSSTVKYKIFNAKFSPDGKSILIAGGEPSKTNSKNPEVRLSVVDTLTGELLGIYKLKEPWIDEAFYSNDGKYLFAVSRCFNGLYVWKAPQANSF